MDCVTVLNFFGIPKSASLDQFDSDSKEPILESLVVNECSTRRYQTSLWYSNRMYRKSKRVSLHSVMKPFKPVALMQIQRLSELNNKEKRKKSRVLVNK